MVALHDHQFCGVDYSGGGNSSDPVIVTLLTSVRTLIITDF